MLKYNEQYKLSDLTSQSVSFIFRLDAKAIFIHSYAQGIDWQYINI